MALQTVEHKVGMCMKRRELYDTLIVAAKQKTATADVLFGKDGKPFEEENFGENVVITIFEAALPSTPLAVPVVFCVLRDYNDALQCLSNLPT